jgi:hypothetical protein
MSKRELWMGLVHRKPIIPRNWSGLDGGEDNRHAGAYSHVVTWASNPEKLRKNAEQVAADWKFYVVDIENEKPLSQVDPSELSGESEAITTRAESNPNAIIWGTFFTYPHEDA